MGDFESQRTEAKIRAIQPEALAERFVAEFMDRAACARWMLEHLHPNGPQCPACGAAVTRPKLRARWEDLGRIRCEQCAHKFSWTAGTIFHGATLSPSEAVLLLLGIRWNLPTATIAAAVDLSTDSVNLWRKKLEALRP